MEAQVSQHLLFLISFAFDLLLWTPSLDPVLHPLRQLVQTTLHVGWHALVDLLGVGQVETLHDLDELLHVLGQPGVELLLLRHGGVHHSLVVMRRVESEGVWQRQDLVPDTPVQSAGAASLEVCSTTSSDEKSVSSEGSSILPENMF